MNLRSTDAHLHGCGAKKTCRLYALLCFIALAPGLFVCAPPAAAQTNQRKPPPANSKEKLSPEKKKAQPDEAPKPPAADAAAPYEAQLLRLSELMGGLAFLRQLCGASDSDDFRQKTQNLLDAESVTPGRREKLIGAFNFGYRGYEANYRSCTQNAEAIITRHLREVGQIAHDIHYKYSGN